LDSFKWVNSIYKPTPTIIEAAQALYEGHSVKEISRSDSGADRAMEIKEEVGLFQVIKSAITKTTETGKESQEEKFDTAIKQILSKAVISDRIIDIFEAAGIQKPELSILSESFLAEVKGMPQKNLAFEALKKLLNDEIRILSKRNIVQGKSFMDMLDKTIRKYTNRSVEAAQIIEELLELARKVREEKNRGKQQNMTEDEIAFYDALIALSRFWATKP